MDLFIPDLNLLLNHNCLNGSFLSLLLLDIVVHFTFVLFVATNKASNEVSFEHFRYCVSIYMYKFLSDKKDHFMHIYVY